jgi:glycosyltransferase involved in cell wall biosynthesis
MSAAPPAPTTLAVVVPDLRVGGLQAMAVRLALALDRAEWAPRFYAFDGEGPLAAELDAAGLPHTCLPRAPGVDWPLARRLAARLAGDGAALVHCHNVTALFHGSRAAWRAGRLPVLYTEHDRDLPAPWRHRLLHRWLARRVTRTVAVSRRLADALVRWEGFPRARTAPLLNGTADPRAACAETRAQARAALGWDDAPVALAVGSLTAVKNHAGLLDAWPAVRARVPGARVVLAGDGPLRPALRAAAAAQPAGAALLLGERHDVPRLLAAADVFVLPSRSEGLSLSLVEAHGAGRPSVACDVGGNAEVLQDGATGRLVPAGDGAALAAALADLLGDPAACARQGQAARARYLAGFTHAAMVSAYVALYRELRDGRAA